MQGTDVYETLSFHLLNLLEIMLTISIAIMLNAYHQFLIYYKV